MTKQELFLKIKNQLIYNAELEEIELELIRSKKLENGEKILKSDIYNEKEYEVVELHSGIIHGNESDNVYLRKVLCVSSIDSFKVPLYKVRYVNIYQLAYELDIIK